ncbi:dihydrofolate reductase [Roseimicrobium gellanilyticum]|uniref:dihydrofolate reductase n=1 Tax=Roseimicrobium gellanilyticum TaxID=748857 RepID=A0A366HFP5_9BACT|nr:dihydrofolate reductase [Roseimicrobium gellanilyticum]RBP41393.1 dihydrofolate reductase [Roseimicrobium gellanilyticum]
MLLSLIAAMDENRLLADARGIPWKLPRDVAHFREYTDSKWLLLGRTTYEEMRGWFRPGHCPLVLSSRCGWDPEIGRVVSSVPQAIATAEAAGQGELVCIGGGQVFAAALPYANKMVLTRVHASITPEGRPVYFPPWNASEWKDETIWQQPAEAGHALPFALHELTRR